MRRVSSSVDKLKRAALLRDTDVAERYEVSPVLALVFTADEVAAVTAEYRRLLGEDGRDSSDSSESSGGSGGSESNGAPEGGLLGGGAPADAGKGGAPAGAPAEERPASPEAASDPVANSSEERDES